MPTIVSALAVPAIAGSSDSTIVSVSSQLVSFLVVFFISGTSLYLDWYIDSKKRAGPGGAFPVGSTRGL